MLASGVVPAENLRPLHNNRANFAIRAENWAVAEDSLSRLVELEPTSVERLWQLAEVKIKLNKNPEALSLYQRLIQIGEESGQRATEERYRRAYNIAANVRNTAAQQQLQAQLLRAYPNAENVGLGLANLRRSATSDAALAIDIRRLMRAAGSFSTGDEYVEFADRLNRAGLPGEARAVLQEGTSRGRIRASDAEARQMLATATQRATEDQRNLAATRTRALAASTGRDARVAGDLYFGNGQYAEAVELYRAALQKGGEDANLVNTRLGAALALAGQRAEAETALRAVSGPRAELANFWLLWLARPAS
jgi:tetratricopeptide (TPR) repeat protein